MQIFQLRMVAWVPSACAGAMVAFVNWPPVEPDGQTCRMRMREIQDVLSEGLPNTHKFGQFIYMMECYESQDWTVWCTKSREKEAAELLQRPWLAGVSACAGLAASANSVHLLAASNTPPTTPLPSFSGGAQAPLPLPLSVSGIQTSASAALIEANRQKALANRAHLEAAVKERYQRDVKLLDAQLREP
jgi:hypothetical protein